MKQLRLFFIVFALLGLVACGGGEEPTTTPATEVAAVATEAPTATLEPTVTLESTAEPTPVSTETPTPPPTATATREPATPTPTLAAKSDPTRVFSSTETKTTVDETEDEDEDVVVEESAAPVAGLEQLDALQLLQDGEANAQLQETIIVDQTTITQLEGGLQTQHQVCAFEVAAKWQHCLVTTTVEIDLSPTPITTLVEVIYRDDIFWIREEGGDWMELPPDALEEAGFRDVEELNSIALSQYITTAEVTRQMRLNAVESYEIEFELDVRAYFEGVVNEETAEQIFSLFDEHSGTGRIWLGVESGLIRRLNMTIQFSGEGGSFAVVTKVTYRFNEPVTIPNPVGE